MRYFLKPETRESVLATNAEPFISDGYVEVTRLDYEVMRLAWEFGHYNIIAIMECYQSPEPAPRQENER